MLPGRGLALSLPRASCSVWLLDFLWERFLCGAFFKAGDGEKKEGLIHVEEATGEPRLGCLRSLGGQRKGGLGHRFRGSAWDKLSAAHCPRV